MNEDVNDSAIVFAFFFSVIDYGNVCFQFKNWKNSKLIFYLLELLQIDALHSRHQSSSLLRLLFSRSGRSTCAQPIVSAVTTTMFPMHEDNMSFITQGHPTRI